MKTGALGGNTAAIEDAYPGGEGKAPPAIVAGTVPGIPVPSPAGVAGAALGGGAAMVAPTLFFAPSAVRPESPVAIEQKT